LWYDNGDYTVIAVVSGIDEYFRDGMPLGKKSPEDKMPLEEN